MSILVPLDIVSLRVWRLPCHDVTGGRALQAQGTEVSLALNHLQLEKESARSRLTHLKTLHLSRNTRGCADPNKCHFLGCAGECLATSGMLFPSGALHAFRFQSLPLLNIKPQ